MRFFQHAGIASRLSTAFALILSLTLILAAFSVARVNSIERALQTADTVRNSELEPLYAARAGERGRGFAVVAGELRNLARRSAAAAREIKVLIEDAVSKVGLGAALVEEAAAAAQSLRQQAAALAAVVNTFQLEAPEDGARRRPAPR